MNFRLLWILMVGLFAYLLFWEWSQESAAKAELVATTRVDEVSSGVDSVCLLYTSPSPRDKRQSRMPSSA